MYITQSPDITKTAEIHQFQLLRQAGNKGRWRLSQKLTRTTRALCLKGIQSRTITPQRIKNLFALAILNQRIPDIRLTGNEMTWIQDSGSLAERLHPLFEQADIPYYVTGGVASTIHGEPRATRDLDLVIQVTAAKLDSLVTLLESHGFYVPPQAVEDMKQGRNSTLNIVHQETIESADLILSPDTPFDRAQLERRQKPSAIGFYLCSAEDAVLQKLRWRKHTRSEKQWNDVLGIIKMQRETLDFDYLSDWASQLGVADELKRAVEAATDEE